MNDMGEMPRMHNIQDFRRISTWLKLINQQLINLS